MKPPSKVKGDVPSFKGDFNKAPVPTSAMQRRGVLNSAISLFLVAGWGTPSLGQAQARGGLYDPEPPADASYVRVIAIGGPSALDLMVDGKPKRAKLAQGEVSEYMILQAGKHQLSLQAAGAKPVHSYSLDVPKGKALTVAFLGKGDAAPVVFEDKANTNKLKAVLSSYYLDMKGGAVDVLTADGNTKVFANLQPGSSASLQVNPIQVELRASKAGSKDWTSPAAALNMSPGATYSVFFVPDAQGKVAAQAFQNTTERYTGKP